MKRFFAIFLAVLIVVMIPVSVYAESGDTIVYVTRTGECYHRGSCSYLSKSKNEITLSEAVKQGYRACSRCKPPALTEPEPTAPRSNVREKKEEYKVLTPAIHPSEVKKQKEAETKKSSGNTGYYLFAAAMAYILYGKVKPKKG